MRASNDENWIVKNASILMTIAINLVVVTTFAVGQAQSNSFQDIRIGALENKVDRLSELNERIARLEETTKTSSEDIRAVKTILLSIQSQK